MAARRGLGGAGRDRLRRNWEDIANEDPAGPNWRTGQDYEDFEEGRVEAADQYQSLISPESVQRLEDKPENYGYGPKFSTRVARHLFVPNNPNGLNRLVPGPGTVYVEFHKRGDVYAYYDVPFSTYQDFARSTSKGRFINNTLNNYLDSTRSNLNGDTSVFTS